MHIYFINSVLIQLHNLNWLNTWLVIWFIHHANFTTDLIYLFIFSRFGIAAPDVVTDEDARKEARLAWFVYISKIAAKPYPHLLSKRRQRLHYIRRVKCILFYCDLLKCFYNCLKCFIFPVSLSQLRENECPCFAAGLIYHLYLLQLL